MNDKEFIERNINVVEQFRANGGKVEGWLPLILVTMKGAKSGKEHIIPLMAAAYEGNYLAVASKGGAPAHPTWYYNLVANPDVTVEVGTEKFAARARMLSGEERAKAFVKAIEAFAPYEDYQKKTDREIPVFALERTSN
jgi:deazaflavin-dependent oxidoreductase (nitroreductase family)